MIEIERYDYPAFRKEYSLDDELFYIYIYWNDRNSCWYMDIENTDEEKLVTGIKLVTLIKLINSVRAHPNIPAGDFYLERQTDSTVDLNYDNFGVAFKLYYYTESEIEAM